MLAAGFSSCNKNKNCVAAEGNRVLHFRYDTLFDNLIIDIPADVVFDIDTLQLLPKIGIRAQNQIHQIINTTIVDGTMTISFDGCVQNHDDITLYITLPSLKKLSMQASGDITSNKILVVDTFEMDLNGIGNVDLLLRSKHWRTVSTNTSKVKLSGEVIYHDIRQEGTESMDFSELIADSTYVFLGSQANVHVYPIDYLYVFLTGSGDVIYHHQPTVKDSLVYGTGNILLY